MHPLLIAANLAVLIILGIAAVVLKWSGPGIAYGMMLGFSIFMAYFRIKYGRWP